MRTKSSKKNKAVIAASLISAVLLCMGAFFVFFTSVHNVSQNVSAPRDIYASESYLSQGSVFDAAHLSGTSPSVSADSAILIVADTAEVVYAKDPDRRMSMASTTKIMTAIVAIENGDVGRRVKIPKEAVGIEGSSIYLYEGECLTLEELLYAMMLESANDAATAIAIEVGGSVDGFAEMMNEKAAELGLENTHFENPHGLDGDGHYTTARELAMIAAYAMENEIFRKIVSTRKITIPLNGDEGTRLLINHNKLLRGYDGAIGIKTGYTKKSGRCLVSAAERDGLELIAVTLNAPNDWQDHSRMLDFGFSALESRVLCEENGFRYILPVVGGSCEYVMIENAGEVRVILPRDCGEVTETLMVARFLYAPVYKGQAVGKLVYSLDGQVIAECDVTVSHTVDRIIYKKVFFGAIRSLLE